MVVLVGAALFLGIMGFAWLTRGGHQCWKVALFQQVVWRETSPGWMPQAKVEGDIWEHLPGRMPQAKVEGGRWALVQLGFHKCIQPPSNKLQLSPFIGRHSLLFSFTSLSYNYCGTFPEYPLV